MIFKKEKKTPEETLYPLISLRDLVLFPHMIIPLFVGRKKSIAALDKAMGEKKQVIFVAQKHAAINDPLEDDIYRIGTKGEILQILKLSDGTAKILIEGLNRVRINEFIPDETCLLVTVDETVDEGTSSYELEALIRRVNSLFEEYVRIRKQISTDALISVISIEDPSRLSDTIAAHLALKVTDKQTLLEIKNVTKRMEKLHELLQKEIEILMAEKKIQGRVKNQMRKNQREYFLNEQMRAIKNELGQQDEAESEMEELRGKIKKAKMPKNVEEKTLKELKRLSLCLLLEFTEII